MGTVSGTKIEDFDTDNYTQEEFFLLYEFFECGGYVKKCPDYDPIEIESFINVGVPDEVGGLLNKISSRSET